MPVRFSSIPSTTDDLTGTLQSTVHVGAGFDGTFVSLAPAAGLGVFLGLRAVRTLASATRTTATGTAA